MRESRQSWLQPGREPSPYPSSGLDLSERARPTTFRLEGEEQPEGIGRKTIEVRQHSQCGNSYKRELNCQLVEWWLAKFSKKTEHWALGMNDRIVLDEESMGLGCSFENRSFEFCVQTG